MSNLRINTVDSTTIKKLVKNHDLFKEFYKTNKFFIEKIVTNYISRTHELFGDMCQVGAIAFLRACEKFDNKRKDASSFSTFAWQVIKNDVLLEIKREQKRNSKNISLEDHMFEETKVRDLGEGNHRKEYSERKFLKSKESGWFHNFEDLMIKKIDIDKKINTLSATERLIYNYRTTQHMTLKQISKKMKINWHTFKVIYYNLRNKIKNEN